MLRVQWIDSLELADLAPYRTMRRPLEHRARGIFVAEGEKVVRRLLESPFVIVSLLLPEKWFLQYESMARARTEDISVYLADKKTLEQLIGFSMFQGVLAIARIPLPSSLDVLVKNNGRPRLFVALEGLSNAENVGVLARNCGAFGVQALLVSKTCSSPFLRRSVRSSMGAIFWLPVLENLDLASTLRGLREQGVRCIAAHPHSCGRKLLQADFTGDCCVVFGSEGHGIAAEVLDACDEAVAIPMTSRVDSLNVGNAAAVFLYEVNRQRTAV